MFRGAGIACFFMLLTLACAPREVSDVDFFYREICPECEGYRRARSITGELSTVDRERDDVEAESHNLIDPSAESLLLQELSRRGLPDVSKSLPLLLVDGEYFVGYDDIEAAVAELQRDGGP